MNTQYLQRKIDGYIGQKQYLQKQQEELEQKQKQLLQDISEISQAKVIIKEVALLTQKQFQVKISHIVTLALQTVFGESYSFEMEFIEKRGKTEVEFWLIENGEKYNPIDCNGGGIVDIICFSLKIAIWTLSNEVPALLVFDEPLKFLSEKYPELAGQILNELSKQLKFQVIMITHNKQLAESSSDKTFYVTKNKFSRIITR